MNNMEIDLLLYLLEKRNEIAPDENPFEFRLVYTEKNCESSICSYSSYEKKRNLFKNNFDYLLYLNEFIHNMRMQKYREGGWDIKTKKHHLCLDIQQIGNKKENDYHYLCEFYVWDFMETFE